MAVQVNPTASTTKNRSHKAKMPEDRGADAGAVLNRADATEPKAHTYSASDAYTPEASGRLHTASPVADLAAAARQQVQAEFAERARRAQAHVARWQGAVTELVEKAEHTVAKAEASVEKAEHKAVEGVRAESQDVMQRIGAFMAHSAIGKWLQQSALKPKAVQKRATRWLATWQKVPDDVRDSLLAVAGLASEQQVLALHQELAALRAELEIHFDDAPTTRRLVVAHPHN